MDNKDKNILVTGANGLLGSYVIRQLLAEGYQKVIGLVREQSDLSLLGEVQDQVQLRYSDILDIINLEKQMRDVDIVVHTAAMVTFDPKKEEMMMKVNGEGTANLVNLSIEMKIDQMIHISSIAAIGRRKKKEVISEDSKWTNSEYDSKYAISKYLSEQEAWRGYHEGLNVAIINPALILGQGDYQKTSIELVSKLAKGQSFYPTGANGFVDVRDVAIAVERCIEREISGQRFILSAENLTYHSLFDKFAAAFGTKPPKYPVRPWMSAILWRLSSVWAFLTSSSPLLTKESMSNLSIRCEYDSSKSREVLGINYRSIDATIQDIVEDYKQKS